MPNLACHLPTERDRISRREAARLIGGAAVAVLLPASTSRGSLARESPRMLSHLIPGSGEKLPVIGLGTWETFDVDPANASDLEPVVTAFARLGGRVVDSSPMYGRSEEVIGQLVSKLHLRDSLFLATKVWTEGKEAGIQSMKRSLARLRTNHVDLMQVHNLVDTETHLASMRQLKAEGRINYIGVTHYSQGAFEELERVLRQEPLDFVQINYSIMEPEAEQRILPVAQDRRVAVIANRPFGAGGLFSRVRDKPLPDFAAEIDCTSWAQFFLKWIVAHPAVTCAIPATDKLQHLEDNMGSGSGRLPDPEMRKRMADYVRKL